MDYTTQMDAARKGIITKELQAVAEKEQMDTARLMQLVAEGKSSNSCKQKPQMPGSKRYRLHVKDQDQCKPGELPETAKTWIWSFRK
mgnify:CR=1 FL=1